MNLKKNMVNEKAYNLVKGKVLFFLITIMGIGMPFGVLSIAKVLIPTAATAAILAACKPEPDAPTTESVNPDLEVKDRDYRIDLFGKPEFSIMAYGNFNLADMVSGGSRFGKKINEAYDAYKTNPTAIDDFETVFGREDFKIIIEVTTAYSVFKTTSEGNVLYINFAAIDDFKPVNIRSIVTRLLGHEAFQAKAAPVYDRGWQRG
ncbi:MAG: hypothetical protein LBH43_02445 [Treponema sp.]|jgi:hypothetical protein|nr:hypothetical protein [Treponema sp.]